jgi:hypothetical protein
MLAVLATLAAALSAPPSYAAARLGRAAAALGRGPLFVHPDLLWLLPAAQRAEIVQTLRASAVPVRVAVLPVIPEDESHGDERRVLFGIQERLDRPGVLVVVDERGMFEIESFDVARHIVIPFELVLPERESPPAIGQRLARLVDVVERAPPGPATRPRPRFEPRSGSDDGTPTVWQVLLVGAFLGVAAHLAVRLVVSLGRMLVGVGRVS